MAKMIQCKTCSKEIAANAKSCPGCGAKNKKAIYKRPWFIVIVVFIILAAIGDSSSSDSKTASSGTSKIEQEINPSNKTESNILVEDDVEEKIPTEYKSALRKAKTYSNTMAMSKAGLYEQLTSEYGEKFSAEAAQYAVDNVNADWKANALKKAKTYQGTMAMSPSAIYDQLVSQHGEKFTVEEAQYAIDNLE